MDRVHGPRMNVAISPACSKHCGIRRFDYFLKVYAWKYSVHIQATHERRHTDSFLLQRLFIILGLS